MGCSSSTAGSLLERTASPRFSRAGTIKVERKFHEEYMLGDKIGEGNFGLVLLASNRSESDSESASVSRAVKVLPLRDEDAMREAQEEVRVWQLATGHSNILDLHDVFFEQSLCYMVMELCTCSVMDHLQSLRQAGESDLGLVLRGMLLGLAHCSSSGVVHRDVKPDNFLLGPPEAGSSCRTVKLADFGLAAALPPAPGLLYDAVGTAPYMSPEMVRRAQGYNEGTDVWSLGVVTYLMLFGEFPFGQGSKTAEAMKEAIARGAAPRFRPADASLREPSSDAMDFVRDVLGPRASTRPTAAEALKLAFMEWSATAEPYIGMDDLEVVPEVDLELDLEIDLGVDLEAASLAHAVAEVISAERSFLLQPVLRQAQKVTEGFRRRADPTVQRDLNNLLCKLQSQHKSEALAGASPLRRSFEAEDVPLKSPSSALSASAEEDALPRTDLEPSDGQLRPRRKTTKCSTWSCESGVSLFHESPSSATTTATFESSISVTSGESSGSQSSCMVLSELQAVRRERRLQSQSSRMSFGLSLSMAKPICFDDTRYRL